MEKEYLQKPLIGVKILADSLDGYEEVEVYQGVSYCDAVRRATTGDELLVVPGSIEVCRWVRPVLGLKKPEDSFEQSLQPRLDAPVAGVYVAPLSFFDGTREPDVVIIRGRPERLHELVSALGDDALITRYRGQIGRTALGVGEAGRLSTKARLAVASDRLFAWLSRFKPFDDLTRWMFKSRLVTRLFERMIKNTVADMSLCRNSTVIPYLEGGVNLSFFCAGGVTWGGNAPEEMTSGFPYHLFQEISDQLEDPEV